MITRLRQLKTLKIEPLKERCLTAKREGLIPLPTRFPLTTIIYRDEDGIMEIPTRGMIYIKGMNARPDQYYYNNWIFSVYKNGRVTLKKNPL